MSSNLRMQQAAKYCTQHGLQYTEPRQRVLSVLLAAEKPLGAYDIIEALKEFGINAKPPTVYRAIEFWLKHHFIHRVESQNGFIACRGKALHEDVNLLVCDKCGDVAEIILPLQRINADKLGGFKPHNRITEVHGECVKCAS